MSRNTIEDVWQTTTPFYNHYSQGQEKSSVGLDVALELIFKLNPNFSLSIGTGYITRVINGSTEKFVPSNASDTNGSFTLSPEIDSDVYPLCLSLIWAYTLWPEARLYINGGAGYYFGIMNCLSDNLNFSPQNFQSEWHYYPHLFKSRTQAIGAQIGFGFEIDVSSNFKGFVDFLYRAVNFKKYKRYSSIDPRSPAYDIFNNEELGSETTILYLQNLGGEESWGDIDYSFPNLRYTGLSFHFGIIYRLNFSKLK